MRPPFSPAQQKAQHVLLDAIRPELDEESESAPQRGDSAPQGAPSAPQRGPPATRERVAVLVTHGMGQQVPFETLDLVVQGLQREAIHRREALPKPGVRTVRLAGQTLSRVELRMGARDVHVYEAYWAPLTEGKITLRDLMSFLWSGAWNGLRNARTEFKRWMFGRPVSFGSRPATFWQLIVAAAALASLVALNGVILGAAAGTLVGTAAPGLLNDLTLVALVFVGISAVFATTLAVAARLNARLLNSLLQAPGTPASKGLSRAVAFAGQAAEVGLISALLGVCVSALAMGALIAVHSVVPAAVLPTLHPVVILATWAGLAWASGKVRGLLVEYMGDVAAYVSSHKLDRFADVRHAIQERAKTVAGAIYSPEAGYTSVILVGHSLGSVVTYDTYNALVNEDLHAEGAATRDVPRRTRLLLTFGSPLDKTAFVYGRSSSLTQETREALAALRQPLILRAEHRPRAWVNISAPRDIISAKLDLYHDPDDPTTHVHNDVDPLATTPLVAHNEYWRTRRVWQALRDGIEGVDPPAPPAPRVRVPVKGPPDAPTAEPEPPVPPPPPRL